MSDSKLGLFKYEDWFQEVKYNWMPSKSRWRVMASEYMSWEELVKTIKNMTIEEVNILLNQTFS